MTPETYTQQAQMIVNAAQAIKQAVEDHGFGTVTIMAILSQLMQMTEVASFLKSLPVDQRDEFFAQVFDEAIGSEPAALVNQVGVFSGETLETITDAIKATFVAYMNRDMPVA